MKKRPATLRRGFTLIELSIVLVIIGLIVGGVLAGRELIATAKVRSAISQMEQYKTAVSLFYNKYNAMPGDIAAARAAQFGFVSRSGNIGDGDGNGFVQACFFPSDVSTSWFGCENILFWADLSSAQLIDRQFPGASGFITDNTVAGHEALWPKSKIGDGIYIVVYAFQGRHYFDLMGIGRIDNGLSTPGPLHAQRYSPATAYLFDSKTDDGQPITGTVRASYGGTPKNLFVTPPAAPSSACAVNSASANIYNTLPGYADANLCALQVWLN